MAFSQIFDATISRERGRLLGGISWSPSFIRGITSASFQDCGKSEDVIEALMILVNGSKMTGRQSFMIRMLTLSFLGAFLVGIQGRS